MAMMKCRECSTDVSTKAANCPKCGAPVKAKSAGCLGTAVVIIGAVFVITMVVGNMSQTDAPAKPAASADDSASREKSVRSQTLVLGIKKSLRNPDSFEAESVLVTEAGAVCAVYRAENGFGGISIEKAVMNAAQTKMIGSNDAGFADLWNRECAGQTGLETKYLYNYR
jgi:hypothetical protein